MALAIQKTAGGAILKLVGGILMGECCCACPANAYCAASCAAVVYAAVNTGCVGAPPDEAQLCDGTWGWTYADTCRWTNFSAPPYGCGTGAYSLECVGGTWSFRVYGFLPGDGVAAYCHYHKAAYTDSCPLGNYVLEAGTCPSCDAVATVYS